MNKQIILIFLGLISILLLSSCRVIGDYTGLLNSDDKKTGIFVAEETFTDIRMEQILSAINDKDSDAIKLLFSKKAIKESNNIDDGIEYLFNYIKGNIDSWKKDGWDSSESIRFGKKTLMIRFSVIISTDEDEYDLFVADYSTDTINPDNEGVYMMQITRKADRNKQESWQKTLCAGIYRPE